VREILKQAEQHPLAVADQVAVLLAATRGLLDALPLDRMRDAEQALCRMMQDEQPALRKRIEDGAALGPADIETLLAASRRALEQFAVF
jgi:F-type H+-transporting ATPase subunit alpha